jgi:hypothetical protein
MVPARYRAAWGRWPSVRPLAQQPQEVAERPRHVDRLRVQQPLVLQAVVGYAAGERAGRTLSYAFGHGLGYTDWAYESLRVEGSTVRVRVRNTGGRAGREVGRARAPR